MQLTMCELVLYQEHYPDIEDVVSVCEQYTSIKKYAILLHDNDGVKPHYHAMLHFGTSFNTDNLLKWFHDLKESQIEKVKCGRYSGAVAYLTHENAPGKHQYPRSLVRANFDVSELIEDELTIKKNGRGGELDIYLQQCVDGTIRQFNMHQLVPGLLLAKHKTKFLDACKIYQAKRKDEIMNSKDSIQVIFLEGGTGTGKTTFSRRYSEEHKLSLCVSSSNNDPLQDYQGEDVLLIDDGRDNTFSYSDLLKILDNHTRTSIKSRYSNKFFTGNAIILTSYVPLHEWYSQKSERDDDDLQQLIRRVQKVITLTDETMQVSSLEYDGRKYRHGVPDVFPNYTLTVRDTPSSAASTSGEKMMNWIKKCANEYNEKQNVSKEMDKQLTIDDFAKEL